MFPFLFEIGNFKLHSYGVLVLIGFLAGLWVARLRAPRFGIDPKQLTDSAFWALLWGVLGARVFYIAQSLPHYLENTDELFQLQFQGLTSFGGVVGGFLYFLWFAKRRKVSTRALFDTLAPGLLIGFAVGRVGCFLNGCCYGGACEAWYCIPVQGQHLRFHPAQLYDSVFNLVGLGLLLAWEKRGLFLGQVTGLAVAFNGLSRFVYEFWRMGSVEEVQAGLRTSTTMAGLPITEAQVVALAMVAIGAVVFGLAYRDRKLPGS